MASERSTAAVGLKGDGQVRRVIYRTVVFTLNAFVFNRSIYFSGKIATIESYLGAALLNRVYTGGKTEFGIKKVRKINITCGITIVLDVHTKLMEFS